mgnify:CR=1 FL=1
MDEDIQSIAGRLVAAMDNANDEAAKSALIDGIVWLGRQLQRIANAVEGIERRPS